MPTTIQAHLLYAGHGAQIGDTLSLTELWITHNLRPDLSSNEYLPDYGDNPIATNIISDQSILANRYTEVFVKNITEQEYLEGEVRGTIYTVQYDNLPFVPEGGWTEPTNNENTIICNISSSSQVDTYSRDPEDTDAPKLWVKPGGVIVEAKRLTVSKVTALTNVSLTLRQRDLSAEELIDLAQLAGKTNTSSMWGQSAGSILFNGCTSTPIQEIVNSVEQINWNVTFNYSIKYVPNIVDGGSWDQVFYNGDYTAVYINDTATTYKPLYERASIPDPLVG